SHYGVASLRQHRWVRGDWQLLPWILARGSGSRRTPIPWIGRWKMLDNLRRSLTPGMTLVAFVLAWTLPTLRPLEWTAILLAALTLPCLFPVLDLLRQNILRHMGTHIQTAWRELGKELLQAMLTIAFLAHHSWLM